MPANKPPIAVMAETATATATPDFREWTMKVMDERPRTFINVISAADSVPMQSKAVPTRGARALLRILKLTLSAGQPSPRRVLSRNEEIFLDENGY